MEILKCNADFSKIYYVEINGSLHQCKFIRTESSAKIPLYVLKVAKIGVVTIEASRMSFF